MKTNHSLSVTLGFASAVLLSACGGGGDGGGSSSTTTLNLVYLVDSPVDETREAYAASADNSEHRALTSGSFGAGFTTMGVSPDGQFVALQGEGQTPGVVELFVVDLNSGLPPYRVSGDLVGGGSVGIPNLVIGATGSFRWSPDGSQLAYVADQDTDEVRELYTVNSIGGNNIKVNNVLTDGGDVFGFAWLPE